MNLSKNKKRRIAAWALFLTLTALVYSSAGAQSSLESVDFVDSDTTLNEENEIIHYVFVMDNNMGKKYSETPAYEKKRLIEFSEKVESENPNALITIIKRTQALHENDTNLADINSYDSNHEKQRLEALLDEAKEEYTKEPSRLKKQNIEWKKASLETWLSSIELHDKIERASRTIIFIIAHGEGHPYWAGNFEVASSNLAKTEGIEFVLLTCMAGNLDLSNTPNIKVFGTGSKHTLTQTNHISGFLEYLNSNTLSPPTSALEFYEAYKTFYNQTPTLIIAVVNVPFEYVRETIIHNIFNALAAYYFNSIPAKTFEALTAWMPSCSTPWFSDPEKQDYRGTKESPWWLLVDSEEYEFLNNTLPTIVISSSYIAQYAIAGYALRVALIQVLLRLP